MSNDGLDRFMLTLALAREIIRSDFPELEEALDIYVVMTTELPESKVASGRRFSPHEILGQDTLSFIVSVISSVVGNIVYDAGRDYLSRRRNIASTSEAREVVRSEPEKVRTITEAASMGTAHAETAHKVAAALLVVGPAKSPPSDDNESGDAPRTDVHE